MSIKQLTVYDDTRAYTCSKGNDDKVLHASGNSIDHLADSSSVGIICQRHRDIVQTLAEQLGEGYNTIVSPWQVRGKFYGAVVIVPVGRTDTHGLDFLNATYLVDNHLQSIYTGVDIVFYLFIAARFDSRCGLDVTTGIYDAEYRVCSS